jgi:hypothetical protein
MDEVDLTRALQGWLGGRHKVLRVGRYVLRIRGMDILMVICLPIFVLVSYIIISASPFPYLLNLDRTESTTERARAIEQMIAAEQTAVAELHAEPDTIDATGQTDKLDGLEAELREIRLAILGDPEKALTLQRMDSDIAQLESRVDTIEALTKWIFGITSALALGVMAALFRAVLRPPSLPKE